MSAANRQTTETSSIPVHMKLTEIQPWVRSFYRELRRIGFGRLEANYLTMGAAHIAGAGRTAFHLAADDGCVHHQELPT